MTTVNNKSNERSFKFNPLADSLVKDSCNERIASNKKKKSNKLRLFNSLSVKLQPWHLGVLLTIIIAFIVFFLFRNLQQKNESLTQNIKELTEENFNIKKQNSQYKENVAHLKSEKSNLEEQISEVKKEKKNLEEENEKFEKKLEDSKGKYNQLKEEYSELETELDNLRDKIDKINKKLDSEKKEREKLQKIADKNNDKSLLSPLTELKITKDLSDENAEDLPKIFINSDIIKSVDEFVFIKNLIDRESTFSFILKYKSDHDEDKKETFQERVSSLGMTVILIETVDGYRFGGFTERNWDIEEMIKSFFSFFNKKEKEEEFKNDERSFIFSLNSKTLFEINDVDKAIYADKKHFLVFGNGDIIIKNNFKSKLCESYFPASYGEKGKNSVQELSGDNKFKVKRIEAFEVNEYK